MDFWRVFIAIWLTIGVSLELSVFGDTGFIGFLLFKSHRATFLTFIFSYTHSHQFCNLDRV